MNRLAKIPSAFAGLVIRTAIISMVLAAPVLAVPTMQSSPGTVIEAPTPDNFGLGFVLMTMLQRN